MRSVVCLLLVFACASVFGAQGNLTTFLGVEGFDVVELIDMSFVNEIHLQTYNFTEGFFPNDTSFFVFGGSTSRSVYPGQPQGSFTVGPGLSRFLGPFIDVHAFMNGSNTYFIGPVNPYAGTYKGDFITNYDSNIAVVGASGDIDNSFAYQPVGFEGTWSSIRALDFGGYVVVYVAGFFVSNYTSQQLDFGVSRFHVNLTAIATKSATPAFPFNVSVDQVTVRPNSFYVTFNPDFKPFMFHMWNVSWNANPNATYTYIIDPAFGNIYTVLGYADPTIPLTNLAANSYQLFGFNDAFFDYGNGPNIVSAIANQWTNQLIIGVAVEGSGAGWLVFFSMYPLQLTKRVQLPTNFSDPRALVLDYFDQTVIYVAGNGGPSVLKISITNYTVLGSQVMPFYLHRVWRGLATHGHVYFVTNEQHSKVFRVAKEDFCPSSCFAPWGYCQKGSCVCPQGMEQQGSNCQWSVVVNNNNTIAKEKGGEIALGLLFAFSFIAAAAGWYLWWRNKRHAYQSV